MPPVTSGEQDDEEVAFQIINQDNFPISIVGQPILKPFDHDAQKSKPNVIVHPTRRIINKIDENNRDSNNDGKNNLNKSHNNGIAQTKLEDFKPELDVEKFSKTLDSKLRRLQKSETKQQKLSNCETTIIKKPFVTTVKKGQFLEPPPEIAILMGMKVEESKIVRKSPKEIKKLYAFSSQPRILSRTPPKTMHQNRYTVETHPALDKKKFKENNPTKSDIQPKWNPNFAFAKLLSYDEVDLRRIEQAKRRSLARTKAINQHTKRPKQKVHALYAVPDHLQKKLLDLSELQQLFVNNKSISDATTQTDSQDYLPDDSKELETNTNDVQIQVHPTDLFDLNSEVQSIVEILVTKTLEEALVEILEEEELMTMKEQQRRFLEYMVTKSSEDPLENDQDFNEENVQSFSRKLYLNSYVPNLITSV